MQKPALCMVALFMLMPSAVVKTIAPYAAIGLRWLTRPDRPKLSSSKVNEI